MSICHLTWRLPPSGTFPLNVILTGVCPGRRQFFRGQAVLPNWESAKNWGRLRGKGLGVGGVGKAGVPAAEVVGEVVVEHSGADLERVRPRYARKGQRSLSDRGQRQAACRLSRLGDSSQVGEIGQVDAGQFVATPPQVVPVGSGPITRREHVDGQRTIAGLQRRLGHRRDGHPVPVPGGEQAGGRQVTIQASARDVKPGEELQRLIGRVVEIAGPILLGQAEEDGFDEVDVVLADVGDTSVSTLYSRA